MKNMKFAVLALVLLLVFVCFVACNGEAIDVKNTYVNEEMHLIVEYTDGTAKDLGYVGVTVEKEVIKEVAPPKYTVTFLDAFGAVLKTETVYKGESVTAPVAPEVADRVFDKWDADLTAVSSDLTVRPVYVAASEYTVTFLDENGNVIAAEKVIHGHAATAPDAPKRENTVFKEWDTAFDSVKGDLTVRAIYRQKETYTVTFKDYTGLLLGTAAVKEGDTAAAPVTPEREGYQFSEWSSSLKNITENKTVTAKYTLKNAKNVFDLSYVLNANGTVTLQVSLVGTVCFAGVQGEMALPSDISNAVCTAIGDTTANIDGGKVYFIYTGATNTTKTTALFSLTFTPADASVSFDLIVSDMYDQDYVAVPYSVIGETVRVK